MQSDDLMYSDIPNYFEDENDIDWNERLLDMEPDEDETADEIQEESEPEPVPETPVLKGYKTPNLTLKYIKAQLLLLEYNRDRIKFKYKGDTVYGRILAMNSSNKYFFDCVDPSTGEHKTRCLSGEYIDSF